MISKPVRQLGTFLALTLIFATGSCSHRSPEKSLDENASESTPQAVTDAVPTEAAASPEAREIPPPPEPAAPPSPVVHAAVHKKRLPATEPVKIPEKIQDEPLKTQAVVASSPAPAPAPSPTPVMIAPPPVQTPNPVAPRAGESPFSRKNALAALVGLAVLAVVASSIGTFLKRRFP